MFNVIKCYKVKKFGLNKVSNHTHRTNLTKLELDRINLDKSSQNRVLVGSNVYADVKNRIKNYSTNKTRKDAVFAEHYVISASPEFFKKFPEKTEEWIAEQVKFLKEEFGPNLTTAVLHADETTLHVEAFVTPIIKNPKTGELELNRKKFNEARGGLNSFKKLQDRHQKHNEKFGLRRGVPKEETGVSATDLETYYKNVKKYIDKIEKYDPPNENDLMPKKKLGLTYSYNDVIEALRKALKIANKTYIKTITMCEKYKNAYKKYREKSKYYKKKLEKSQDETRKLNKNIKVLEETAKQLKPLVDLGEKVIRLGMTDDIENEYEKLNAEVNIVKIEPQVAVRADGEKPSEDSILTTHRKHKI